MCLFRIVPTVMMPAFVWVGTMYRALPWILALELQRSVRTHSGDRFPSATMFALLCSWAPRDMIGLSFATNRQHCHETRAYKEIKPVR